MATVTDRLAGARSSLAYKAPCKVATTANITLSAPQTIDGVAVVAEDRVLVKNQTNGAENGIYEVKAGAWTRAADWNASRDVTQGTKVSVVQGSTSMGVYELTTTGTIVVGTTSISFTISDLALGNYPYPAGSRTVLKALDTSIYSVAYLTESLREGLFVFRSGDYSTEVANDSEEGIYLVADDTASTAGVWERAYSGPIFFEWFGGVNDNTTDNSTAIQAAIDYAATFTQGATVAGRAGQYAIASGVTWKPKVSFDLDEGCHIRAKSSMVAMIVAETGASNRISRVSFRGGHLDAAGNAERCFFLKECDRLEITNFRLADCNGNFVHIGTTGQSESIFEITMSHGFIAREDLSAFTSETVRGIYFDVDAQAASDCHFSDIIINGCKFGVQGDVFSTRFEQIHPWSDVTTQGTMEQAFFLNGNNLTLYGCDADNWSTYGYHITGINNVLIASKTNRSTDQTDVTGSAVFLGSGTTITVVHNVFKAASASNRIATEIAGDTSGVIARDNYTENVVTTFGNSDLSAGKQDTTPGTFTAHGGGTGEVAGKLVLANDADNDGTVGQWVVQPSSGALAISRDSTSPDFILHTDGGISMLNLPSTNPAVLGQLWTNSNVVTISTG